MIKEFLRNTTKIVNFFDNIRVEIRLMITCPDGFTFFAQASSHHYCTPRKNLKDGGTTVESWYPKKNHLLMYIKRTQMTILIPFITLSQ